MDWSETFDDEIDNGVPLRLRRYNRDKDDKFFQDERFKFSYIDPANDKTGEMFSVEETEKPPLTTPRTMYRRNNNIKL